MFFSLELPCLGDRNWHFLGEAEHSWCVMDTLSHLTVSFHHSVYAVFLAEVAFSHLNKPSKSYPFQSFGGRDTMPTAAKERAGDWMKRGGGKKQETWTVIFWLFYCSCVLDASTFESHYESIDIQKEKKKSPKFVEFGPSHPNYARDV